MIRNLYFYTGSYLSYDLRLTIITMYKSTIKDGHKKERYRDGNGFIYKNKLT